MTDTITPASLRAHADRLQEDGHLAAAVMFRMEADRLEAESARDQYVDQLAEVYRVAFKEAAGDSYIADGSWTAAGVRAVLARLAADGRLLPEGGTDWQKRAETAEAELEEALKERDGWEERLTTLIYTFADVAEVGEWSSGNELDETFIDHMHGKLQKLERLAYPASTPPAVSVPDSGPEDPCGGTGYVKCWSPGGPCSTSVCELCGPCRTCDPGAPIMRPDSGPDGTPEKPWPTWQDVPEGVKVTAPGMYPGEQLAKAGGKTQHWCGDLLCCTDSLNGGTFVGPFVRVDGDKA